MRKNYHVTRTENGWQAKLENDPRPVVTGTTKKEVLGKTIEIAKKQDLASIRIHRANGTIQEERTYPKSSDPHGSRG